MPSDSKPTARAMWWHWLRLPFDEPRVLLTQGYWNLTVLAFILTVFGPLIRWMNDE